MYNTNTTCTNIHFPKKQLEKLEKAKEFLDMPIAEIVRRAVDDYLMRTLKL